MSPHYQAFMGLRLCGPLEGQDVTIKQSHGGSGKQARPGIVVGPSARLELISEDANQFADQAVIEAKLPASQYREISLIEG